MPTSRALKTAIGVLMADSIIELSFISSTVAWLHKTASGTFPISDNGSTFNLQGKPLHLLVDQGHTSNGAAGTAFVLIGLGGIVSLWLRNRAGKLGHALYYLWLVLSVLALMLTLGALSYVFAVTDARRHQTINLGVAATLNGGHYPLDSWTPQNWFAALLKLDVADGGVRNDIKSHLKVMRGWQYNLIPFFLVQVVQTVLAVKDGLRWRRDGKNASARQEKSSTHS